MQSTRPLAVIVEAVAGWLGCLGIGHIIVGISEDRQARVLTGLALLIAWWLILGAMVACVLLTIGIALFCVAPIWFIVPVLSALSILIPDAPAIGGVVGGIEDRFDKQRQGP